MPNNCNVKCLLTQRQLILILFAELTVLYRWCIPRAPVVFQWWPIIHKHIQFNNTYQEKPTLFLHSVMTTTLYS